MLGRVSQKAYRFTETDDELFIDLLDYSSDQRRLTYTSVARVPHNYEHLFAIRSHVEQWFGHQESEDDYRSQLIKGKSNPEREWNNICNHFGIEEIFSV